MLKLLTHAFMERTTRLQRVAAIAAAAFALGGAGEASAEVIFDNVTGPLSAPTSSGGYVVGEYSPGSVYALGGVFTVPVNGPLDLVGGSIAVSFDAASTGMNEMDLEIAEDVGGADPVGAIIATATISSLPTVLTLVDFTVSPEALLTPGGSYWLLASMPDPTATAYWWAADIAQGAYPVAVAYNGGVFALGSHTQPVMFTIDAVPEPSTWAMILIGFGLMAWIAAVSSPAATRRPLVSMGGSSGGDRRRIGGGNSSGDWWLRCRSPRRPSRPPPRRPGRRPPRR
jgi:PEP-CTERM motif